MRYLSFDIEATGLREHDFLIEFGMLPFDTETKQLDEDLAFHYFVKCPSFEELKPDLDPWVVEHNEELIKKAHSEGLSIEVFKTKLTEYLESDKVKKYFSSSERNKITLFGKSMSAIDLPFMNRDLGWEYMRKHFNHRQLDLSSMAYGLIDLKMLPLECASGSALMNYVGMGEVLHTALEDARNTALIYLKLLEKFEISNKS
jgi:DNA polymerase III epsilon subunit-like protein